MVKLIRLEKQLKYKILFMQAFYGVSGYEKNQEINGLIAGLGSSLLSVSLTGRAKTLDLELVGESLGRT